MHRKLTNRRFQGTALAGVLGIFVLLASGAHAFAQSPVSQDDDDDDTFEQKIIKGMLNGLGVDTGRPTIDYRERSPLVIPPSTNLPPPDSNARLVKNPAWPNDPDTKKHKPPPGETRLVNGSLRNNAMENPQLMPSELNKGRADGASKVTAPDPNANLDPGRPVMPDALGYAGGLMTSVFGYTKEESEPFTGEVPRTNLTQPPAGYQTPSPAYPYGIAPDKKSTSTLSLPIVKDRAVGQE